MLTSNNVKEILRRVSGVIRSATVANSLGTTSFIGNGLDDMTINVTDCTAEVPIKFIVAISATGTPDSIRYSVDNGTTWAVQTSITGAAQALTKGITVTFGATTGHTLGETWEFVTSPAYGTERLRDFTGTISDIEVLNNMLSAVYSAGKSPVTILAKYKTDMKAVVTALGNAVNAASLDAYLTSQSLLVNCDIVDNAFATVSAENVIPPQTVLGDWVYSGSGAGTWTSINAVDTTKYQGGLIELYALSAITDSGSDGMVSITGVDFNNDAVSTTAAVAFSGSLAQYDIVDLSSAYPQRFKSISNISVSGGATGQKFQIRTKEDWKPIL